MKKIQLLIAIALLTYHSSAYGQGTRYSGSYTPSTTLFHINESNIVIEGKSFIGLNGKAIDLYECTNVIIRNCKFKNLPGIAIASENSKGLIIEDCVFDSVADGVLANTNPAHTFNGGLSSGVKVQHNYFKNTMGGWPCHHAVMFSSVNGGGGNLINYNSFENIHLQSHVDDIVSVYKSYGTVNDSIQIIGNWLRGGDWNDENHTGSGITFGDNGGSYIHVKNNVIVNIVSGAIGNAGANNSVVENNIIYQSQELASPKNVTDGYIMYNFNPIPSEADCYANVWKNNRGLYYYNNGIESTYRALNYPTNNCTAALQIETNVVDLTLKATVLPQNISGIKGVVTDDVLTPAPSEANYKIYPNPVYNKLIIETTEIPKSEKVMIYNLQGQIMYEQQLLESSTEINTSNLSTGVCIVKIYNGATILDVKKIIVLKK